MKIILSRDGVTTAIINHIESLGLMLDIKQVTFTGIGDVEVELGDKKTKNKKTEANDITQEEDFVEANTEQSEESDKKEETNESKNSYSIFG